MLKPTLPSGQVRKAITLGLLNVLLKLRPCGGETLICTSFGLFSQLPALQLPSGKFLPQSAAIERYLARKGGVYPSDTDLAYVVDVVKEVRSMIQLPCSVMLRFRVLRCFCAVSVPAAHHGPPRPSQQRCLCGGGQERCAES